MFYVVNVIRIELLYWGGGRSMKYKIGDIVDAKVSGIKSYGIFVSLNDSTKGLIHISECYDGYVPSLNSLFQAGQTIKAVVMDVQASELSLSIRALKNGQNLHSVPKPVDIREYRKVHWTNFKDELGFQPIRTEMGKWKQDYQIRLNSKK